MKITKTTYYNRPIDVLSKKELLEVIELLTREVKEYKPKSDWYEEHKLDLIEKGLI